MTKLQTSQTMQMITAEKKKKKKKKTTYPLSLSATIEGLQKVKQK